MKKNQTKRLLALVLTLALTLSNVPTTVFAEDVTATEPQSTTEQQVQSQEDRLPGRAGDPEQGGGAAHGRAGYLPRRGRGLRG